MRMGEGAKARTTPLRTRRMRSTGETSRQTGGTPDGLHPEGLVKYAVMVKSVLGYLFLAIFVVVLARKIIR